MLERLFTAPKLPTTNNSSETVNCSHCLNKVKPNSTVIQWEWLAFCDTTCFESFILKNNHGCVMCSKECDLYCELSSVHVHGNRFYLFCSDQCAKVFFDVVPFCRYCRRICDPIKMIDGFCHAMCQQKFDTLYATSVSTVKQICCIECTMTTNPNVWLSFAGRDYGFCSYRCYFYRTLQCQLFPGMHESHTLLIQIIFFLVSAFFYSIKLKLSVKQIVYPRDKSFRRDVFGLILDVTFWE